MRSEWLIQDIEVESITSKSAFTVFEYESTMITLIGIAKHKFLARQGFSAFGARDVFPPQFAVSASDSISYIYFIDMIFEGFTAWTDCESKLLFTAFAFKFIMPFKNSLMLIEDILPTTNATDQFERERAGDARDIRSHPIVVLLLVEQFQTILLGAAKIVHGMVAVGAGDDLSEIRFVQEDGLVGLFAVGADPQSPELVSTGLVADMGGEGLAHALGILGGLLAFRAYCITHLYIYSY